MGGSADCLGGGEPVTLQKLKNPLPGDFCMVCGGKPEVIGLFVPEDPES